MLSADTAADNGAADEGDILCRSADLKRNLTDMNHFFEIYFCTDRD